VAPQHALALIAAVLHQFLDCASLEQKRMRDLLQQMSAETFLQQLQRRVDFPLFESEQILQWRRQVTPPHAHIGIAAQIDDRCTIGAVPTLGRLDAAQLLRIASIAEQYGEAAIHLTPWQSILLPDIAVMDIDLVLQQLKAIGLHVSNGQPLALLLACSGATGCAKGLADTKADALQLADLVNGLPAHFTQVHLTGCARSCACAYAAPFTLLAVDDGRYDLFLHVDRDRYYTDGTDKFGTRVASSIDVTAAAAYLRQFSNSEHPQ
jgi:precorrin-3B synthase